MRLILFKFRSVQAWGFWFMASFAIEITALLCFSALALYIARDFNQSIKDNLDIWPELFFSFRFYTFTLISYLAYKYIWTPKDNSSSRFLILYGEHPKHVALLDKAEWVFSMLFFMGVVVFLSTYIFHASSLLENFAFLFAAFFLFLILDRVPFVFASSALIKPASDTIFGYNRAIWVIALISFYVQIHYFEQKHPLFFILLGLFSSYAFILQLSDHAALGWMERQTGLSQNNKELQIFISGGLCAAFISLVSLTVTPLEIALVFTPFLLCPFLLYQINPHQRLTNILLITFASLLLQSLWIIDLRLLVGFPIILYILHLQQRGLYYRS